MSVCNSEKWWIWKTTIGDQHRWLRSLDTLTLNVWSRRWTDAELRALTTAIIPLKLFSSWKTIIISRMRDTTATRSSRFSVSTIHFSSQNVNYIHRTHTSLTHLSTHAIIEADCTKYGSSSSWILRHQFFKANTQQKTIFGLTFYPY